MASIPADKEPEECAGICSRIPPDPRRSCAGAGGFRNAPAFPMLATELVVGKGGNGTTATSSGFWVSGVRFLGDVLLVPEPSAAKAGAVITLLLPRE